MADQPDLDPVDAIGLRDDVVAEVVDDGLVELAVDLLGLLDELASSTPARPARGSPMRGAQRPIASSLAARESRDRLALEDQAELEGVADQAEVDGRDLQAALRHRDDQALGLEPGDQLADGAERQAGERDELALADELAGLDVAREEALREAR